MKRLLLAIAILTGVWATGAPAGAPAAPSAKAAPAAPPAAKAAPPAKAAAPPAPSYQDALIKDVPHVRQKPDFCGEACAEMYLARLGRKWTQDDVFNAAGLDPMLARGCHTQELAAALRRIGFRVGDASYAVAAAKAAGEMEAQWAALHADLRRGIPSIVCTHYDDKPATTEHFRLVLGYDRKADEVIYHEPAEDDGAYRRMKRDAFLKLWPLKYDPKLWTVIRMRLEPGDLRNAVRQAGFTPADFAQHIMALKKKVPAGFSLAMAPPFVVVGDEPPQTVRIRAQGTVAWAVQRLKADYFAKDPPEIISVWLFKDQESYERNTQAIFGCEPHTPFGWYSSADQALIMNIATGGGTLVHEIVHPFMRANFPECPDWFNEGLASLYEQSEEKGGHIHGRTNWRLAGLQQAIREGKLISFEALTATTTGRFYNADKGSNYAQARYLCYYLQGRGLLVKFYREFVANHKDDPTGYETLKAVLGEQDMAAFQKRWEAYVLGLRFP
jgi:hypothetical protein